jgi:hypothetical protein
MPFAEFSPAEVGTSAGGFRLVGTAQGLLRVTVWGYWPTDVVRSFAVEASTALQKLGASGTLIVDASDLKPQGAEGQEALRMLFRGLVPLSLAKATVIASNALTRMQLARLLRESGVDGRVEISDSSSGTPGA